MGTSLYQCFECRWLKSEIRTLNPNLGNVHVSLARAVPGLEKLVVNRVTGSPMGETDLFLIAEMHFPDHATFDAAMRSEENRAAGKDLANFAKGLVTIVFAEEAWKLTPPC
jgi:uncharacterized protein (TIGR02118 family)